MNNLNLSTASPQQKLKAVLAIKKITQAHIARKIGLTRQAVNHVLSGHVKSRRRREQICKAVGISYVDIWE